MSDVDEPDGQKSTQNFIIIDTEGQGILLQRAMEKKKTLKYFPCVVHARSHIK